MRLLADQPERNRAEFEATAAQFAHRFATVLRKMPPPAAQTILTFARFLLDNAELSSSQNFQDIWVMYETHKKRNGFFVEFGATDGLHLSNTYALETELGWSGLLAEPNPVWHESLRRNRSAQICERCVLDELGRTVEFVAADQADLSTVAEFIDSGEYAAYRKQSKRMMVETISLHDLLQSYQAPNRIDYMSIDTEGSEYDIIKEFRFDAFDIGLISIEYNSTENRRKIHDLLGGYGYVRRFAELSAADDWYVKTK